MDWYCNDCGRWLTDEDTEVMPEEAWSLNTMTLCRYCGTEVSCYCEDSEER